jgi:hypothetical protein
LKFVHGWLFLSVRVGGGQGKGLEDLQKSVIEGPSKTMVPSTRVTKLGAWGVLISQVSPFQKRTIFPHEFHTLD